MVNSKLSSPGPGRPVNRVICTRKAGVGPPDKNAVTDTAVRARDATVSPEKAASTNSFHLA